MAKLLEIFQKDVSPPPLWLMRQAGRYLPEYQAIRSQNKSFLDLCYSPKLAAEITLLPLKRFPLDGAILFSDILVIPDALGQKVSFDEGKGPRLFPLSTQHPLLNLNFDQCLTKLSPIFEALSLLRQKLSPSVALIGFSGAPWTLAAYMVEGKGSTDFSSLKSFITEKPHQFSELIASLTEIISLYIIEQIRAGAQIVQLFDSWSFHAPIERLEEWIIEPIRLIVQKVQQLFPQIPIIGYTRQLGTHLREYVLKTKIQAVGLDSTVDLVWAENNLPREVIFQGNISPNVLLQGGKQLEEAVNTIHQQLSSRRYILNSGEGVLPSTPIPHIEQLIQLKNQLK